MQRKASDVLRKDTGLQRPDTSSFGVVDEGGEEGVSDASPACIRCHVDGMFGDSAVRVPGRGRRGCGPTDDRIAVYGHMALGRQLSGVEVAPARRLDFECGVSGCDAAPVDGVYVRPVTFGEVSDDQVHPQGNSLGACEDETTVMSPVCLLPGPGTGGAGARAPRRRGRRGPGPRSAGPRCPRGPGRCPRRRCRWRPRSRARSCCLLP